MKSLPTIYGPSDFNVRVNTHFAEESVIGIYAECLKIQFDSLSVSELNNEFEDST